MQENVESRPLLLTPGPTIVHPSVLEALSRPQLAHNSPEFLEVLTRLNEKMRETLRMKNGRLALITGSGTLGIEAVAASLVGPGDRVLVLSSGFFGDRAASIFSSYAARVDVIGRGPGLHPPLEEVEEALGSKDYKLVFVTHVDTSTGLMVDLEEVARIVKGNDVLLVVDAVSTVGGARFEFDKLGVDAAITSSQKCLAAPPGIAAIGLSERAFSELRAPRSFYLDLREWVDVTENPGKYKATPAVNLMVALEKALDIVLGEGLEARWRRHEEQSEFLRSEMRKRGFDVIAEVPSPTVSVFDMQSRKLDAVEIREKLYKKHGIWVATGTKPNRSRYLRIGHMGNISVSHLELFLEALDDVLAANL